MQKENILYSLADTTKEKVSHLNEKITPLIEINDKMTLKAKIKYVASIFVIGILGSGVQLANANAKFLQHRTSQVSKSNMDLQETVSYNPNINAHDADILIRYGFMEPPKSNSSVKKTFDTQNNKAYQIEKQGMIADKISEKYDVKPAVAEKMVKEAYIVGNKHGVKPEILLGIAAVESGFNPKARNRSGAIGLMQALPRAHRDKISEVRKRGGSMYNISDNLDVGAQIYGELLTKYKGNTTLALQAYNGSITDRSKRYSKKVLQAISKINVPDIKIAFNN